MYWKIIAGDMKRSRLVSAAVALFIAASAALLSLAAILFFQLYGAADALMEQAKTPHFMQMHAGTADEARLASFAVQNEDVQAYQLCRFLNIDGAQFRLKESTLSGSVQDNGLCVQGEGFDYLLDMDGRVIEAAPGELYVPLCYERQFALKAGDAASVCGRAFTIAGFLRDSQMNSTLASSKRFLVNAGDYAALTPCGSEEYLISFRLKDQSKLGAFAAAYTAAGLEANGPTITYPLFRMISVLSDGMMAAVILLASLLSVLIAFACIRFTLLAKVEDDYREIGVMKGVGLQVSTIKRIYLAQYLALAAAGSVLGYGLSLLLREPLLANIRRFMGEGGNDAPALFAGAIGVTLVFFAVLAYVNGVLGRFRKLSAAQAIRFGAPQEQKGGSKALRLSRSGAINVNLFLGARDVLQRKKLYGTLLLALVFSTFIMVVPLKLYATISSGDFVRYMGAGDCDMRIDIQQTAEPEIMAQKAVRVLEKDPDLAAYALLITKMYTLRTAEGAFENLCVELGEHNAFPVGYISGSAPAAPDEIALSELNAEALGLQTGGILHLQVNGNEREMRVCGVYPDINNGGKTAKAAFADRETKATWCVINASFKDPSMAGEKVAFYKETLPGAKVCALDEYVRQLFGATILSVKKAACTAAAAALFIAALITLLSVKMLLAKDRCDVAVLRACGFTAADIRAQYAARAALVMLVGLALGTLLANSLGELLAGALLSSMGAASFRFVSGGLLVGLLCPVAMLFATMTGAYAALRGAGKAPLYDSIKE